MIEPSDRTTLPRAFFDRPVLEVAPDLLGCTVIRRTAEGPIELRITEVEAYAGEVDPGSHAFRGRTGRNEVMFGPPGHAYVYFTYGMWHCLNAVCGPEGRASGVLLRAGEIQVGAELARKRRISARNDKELAKGPARLATALDIDRKLNGTDLCRDTSAPLSLLPGPAPVLTRYARDPAPESAGTAPTTPGASGSTATPPSAPIAHTPRAAGQLDSTRPDA